MHDVIYIKNNAHISTDNAMTGTLHFTGVTYKNF